MKRIFLTGLFASLIAVACFAQKPYKVVFYLSLIHISEPTIPG